MNDIIEFDGRKFVVHPWAENGYLITYGVCYMQTSQYPTQKDLKKFIIQLVARELLK